MLYANILFFIMLSAAFYYKYNALQKSRIACIENYNFNAVIRQRISDKYSRLTDTEIDQLLEGLRSYFYVCNKSGGRVVAMPSKAVDFAWHEFILHTKEYEQFCKRAIGRFLHHMPVVGMTSPTQAQEGIRRAWEIACARECINPYSPRKLPLLFAIDQELAIEDGYHYVIDCEDPLYLVGSGGSNVRFCAGHIARRAPHIGFGCSGSSRDSGDCGGGD